MAMVSAVRPVSDPNRSSFDDEMPQRAFGGVVRGSDARIAQAGKIGGRMLRDARLDAGELCGVALVGPRKSNELFQDGIIRCQRLL